MIQLQAGALQGLLSASLAIDGEHANKSSPRIAAKKSVRHAVFVEDCSVSAGQRRSPAFVGLPLSIRHVLFGNCGVPEAGQRWTPGLRWPAPIRRVEPLRCWRCPTPSSSQRFGSERPWTSLLSDPSRFFAGRSFLLECVWFFSFS
jgi:hypothetical protein